VGTPAENAEERVNVKRSLAVAFVILGLAVGALGLSVLPAGHGRFEYMVEVVDPRPAAESTMPEALAEMGATRAVVMANPSEGGRPRQLLLLPELPARLKMSDCALGVLPAEPGWSGLAGFNSGLERGTISIADHRVSICGQLQSLAPVFDASLVMELSEGVESALEEAGWEGHAQYFLFAESWGERKRLMAGLERNPEALPTADAEIVSPARKPLLSKKAQTAVSAALICAGLLVLGWQVRGMSRDDVARRFGRG